MSQITSDWAEIDIAAEFVNETWEARDWEAKAAVRDPWGTILAEQKMTGRLGSCEEGGCEWSFSVSAPRLWSPETPFLYTAVISVFAKGELADAVEVSFGIRTVAFDADRGFLLNGSPYAIKGVCCHQDFAGAGVALPDSLIEYKIDLLKKLGAFVSGKESCLHFYVEYGK